MHRKRRVPSFFRRKQRACEKIHAWSSEKTSGLMLSSRILSQPLAAGEKGGYLLPGRLHRCRGTGQGPPSGAGQVPLVVLVPDEKGAGEKDLPVAGEARPERAHPSARHSAHQGSGIVASACNRTSTFSISGFASTARKRARERW